MKGNLSMIPTSILYLGIMLAAIIVWFVLLKRPVYEAVLVSFILLLVAVVYIIWFEQAVHKAGRKIQREEAGEI